MRLIKSTVKQLHVLRKKENVLARHELGFERMDECVQSALVCALGEIRCYEERLRERLQIFRSYRGPVDLPRTDLVYETAHVC